MKKLFFLFLLPIVISCHDEDINLRGRGHNDINIYLVKEGQVERFQTDVNLESLEVERNPWLKSSEIEFYDGSSNIFYLNTEKEKGNYEGRNFLIQNGNTPLLLGLFFASYWSYMPQFPSIIAHDDLFYPKDVIGLGGYGFYTNTDSSQEMLNFKQALEDSGILKEGIGVEVVDVDKVNSTTLKYTIRVTNNDTESIYVLDPGRMGESRFHYYTNGVSLRKDNESYSSFSEKTASSEIKSSWYYKLRPQKSMVRTITLGGYSDLPEGNVHFYFTFPGANINDGEWKKPDGRIWLGSKFVEGDIDLK